MGDKKVFCRRAEELKSIDELELSDKVKYFFRICDMPAIEVLTYIRYSDLNICGSELFWMLATDYSKVAGEDIFLEMTDEQYKEFMVAAEDELVDFLESAGYVRRDLYRMYVALWRILGPSYFEDEIFRLAIRDEKDDYLEDDIEGYNERYEECKEFTDEKVDRIIDLLKDNLSPSQFEIIEFFIAKRSNWRRNYYFTEDEEKILRQAFRNCMPFREEIKSIILS